MFTWPNAAALIVLVLAAFAIVGILKLTAGGWGYRP